MLRITTAEFVKLTKYIKDNYGINLPDEKRALVIGRLQHHLAGLGFYNFSQYYEYVVSDKTGLAATELINRITTNHTFFMREVDHFFYFRDKILPHLKATVRSKDLRIWSAGCSTGEEPYTLAMIIDEFFGEEKGWWDTKILATDISSRALERAKIGMYDNEGIAKLPSNWRLNYFQKIDSEMSKISEKIANEVIFRKFNLMDKVFPFKKKFHVIFCRNVMIYFDIPTKEELVRKFYNNLEDGGYLFIGHSESINRTTSRFKYVMPAVYRKD